MGHPILGCRYRECHSSLHSPPRVRLLGMTKVRSAQNLEVCRRSNLCHPERTRISYYAAPETATCAVPARRDRMNFAEPVGLNRKSGAVEGSAVLFLHPVLHRSPRFHWFPRSSSFAASATCSGVIVSKPASGSACREWSRLLSGCRNTRKGTPKGPFRLGSVGP